MTKRRPRLRNKRKTGPVSSPPPEGPQSPLVHWRRAAAPFAIQSNTRKTGPVSSSPPEGPQSPLVHWRRAAEPFALQSNTRKTGPVSSSPPEGPQSSLCSLAARSRALCDSKQHAQDGPGVKLAAERATESPLFIGGAQPRPLRFKATRARRARCQARRRKGHRVPLFIGGEQPSPLRSCGQGSDGAFHLRSSKNSEAGAVPLRNK
jgi:hypothetical protein